MAEIDDEIARMRDALHAVSDSELASLLGLGRSAVSQWRKRGAVPESAKAKAAHVEAHLRQYANATGQVALLEPTMLTYARALAIAYAYRHASKAPARLEDGLPEIAAAFDHVTLAAAKAIDGWTRAGLDTESAFETLLIEGNLEPAMVKALLPSHLPQ